MRKLCVCLLATSAVSLYGEGDFSGFSLGCFFDAANAVVEKERNFSHKVSSETSLSMSGLGLGATYTQQSDRFVYGGTLFYIFGLSRQNKLSIGTAKETQVKAGGDVGALGIFGYDCGGFAPYLGLGLVFTKFDFSGISSFDKWESGKTAPRVSMGIMGNVTANVRVTAEAFWSRSSHKNKKLTISPNVMGGRVGVSYQF